jgi:hypothetical protein
MPMVLRAAIAIGCVLGGIWLHYAATVDFGLGLVLWLGLATGAGFMLPYWWIVAIAPIPWLAGVAGGVLLGQHDDLGGAWALSLIFSTLAGVIGVVLGAAVRGGRRDPNLYP